MKTGEATDVTLHNATASKLSCETKDKAMTVVDWDGQSGLMTGCQDIDITTCGTLASRDDFDTTCYTFNADGSFGNQRDNSTFPPYRMYLKITDASSLSAPLRSLSIGIFGGDDDNTTGIIELTPSTTPKPQANGVFTLDGRAVNPANMAKGIYIVNGKKRIK